MRKRASNETCEPEELERALSIIHKVSARAAMEAKRDSPTDLVRGDDHVIRSRSQLRRARIHALINPDLISILRSDES